MKRNVEILAPAGSWDSLCAAVCAGADAVYIGGSRFGARAYADNLNEEQMLEAAEALNFEQAAKLRDKILALKGERPAATGEKSRRGKRKKR